MPESRGFSVMKRRSFLRGGMQGLLALGTAKALHNTVIGYGQFGIGDNLLTQDLTTIANTGLPSLRGEQTDISGTAIRVYRGRIRHNQNGQWRAVNEAVPDEVQELEGIIMAIQEQDVTYQFSGVDDFFTFLEGEVTSPVTVALLRQQPAADPAILSQFEDVDPTKTPELVNALASVFREHTRYDIPRYLAGSIDDNVLPVDGELRRPFEPTADFETLHEETDPIGLFCTEYTELAKTAFHAVPADEQSHPIFSFRVRNARHKHVYNGIGSVVIRDDRVLLPMTFVDYTDSTLVDDFRVRGLVGEQIDAYNENHRADEFHW